MWTFLNIGSKSIDLFHGRHCVAKSTKFENHLPTTQCVCVDFVDFATQRNGGHGCEKDQ
jgi:hypothetical protein